MAIDCHKTCKLLWCKFIPVLLAFYQFLWPFLLESCTPGQGSTSRYIQQCTIACLSMLQYIADVLPWIMSWCSLLTTGNVKHVLVAVYTSTYAYVLVHAEPWQWHGLPVTCTSTYWYVLVCTGMYCYVQVWNMASCQEGRQYYTQGCGAILSSPRGMFWYTSTY